MQYKIKDFIQKDISKFYILAVGILCLLLLSSYFSYALFTVTKEKKEAISMVAGNINYTLMVDDTQTSTLTISANSVQEFTIVLANTTSIPAKFNFYYIGDLPAGITAGYEVVEGVQTPPAGEGIILQAGGSSDSSNTYLLKVYNNSSTEKTITLGVSAGLSNNDLSLPSEGHLFEELKNTVSEVLLASLPDSNQYDDGLDTYIVGDESNNYIWYSGKLWRAVSVDDSSQTVKLVTQWDISSVVYYSNNHTAFEGSYMQTWLNDTSIDGFLGNLRDYEDFIASNASWDATMNSNDFGSISRPTGATTVTAAVGLLNTYEYQTSCLTTNYEDTYLNNGLEWWTLTPSDSSSVWTINYFGYTYAETPTSAGGVRPAIVLQTNIEIVAGDGSENNPYRLKGDYDTDLAGTSLSSRYSGEYIHFGTGVNNLYRIVSHETSGLTKITSADPLKDSVGFPTSTLGNASFSSSSTMGRMLNGTYLTSYVGNTYTNMIQNSSTWYLGTVANGTDYRLAKYRNTSMSSYATSTSSRIGLLRLGELMARQFATYDATAPYWILTRYNNTYTWHVDSAGYSYSESPSTAFGIKPALNLKSNVVIVSGDGTKNSPFEIELG